jgi:hypothetical protein
MGAAIAIEDAFHSLLEQEFNQESDSTNYEFINFGVENYGLGEMMGTTNHKALRYEPDMILFVITGFTPMIRWEPHETPFVPLPRKNTGWTSYVGLRLAGKLGFNREPAAAKAELRDIAPTARSGLYSKQLERAFNELAAIARARQLRGAVVWLRLNEPGTDNNSLAEVFLGRAERAGVDGAVVDLENYLEPGQPLRKLLVNRSEMHPNEYGHKMIAAELREKIFPTGPPAIQRP